MEDQPTRSAGRSWHETRLKLYPASFRERLPAPLMFGYQVDLIRARLQMIHSGTSMMQQVCLPAPVCWVSGAFRRELAPRDPLNKVVLGDASDVLLADNSYGTRTIRSGVRRRRVRQGSPPSFSVASRFNQCAAVIETSRLVPATRRGIVVHTMYV